MNTEKRGIRIQGTVCDRIVVSDLANDFSLPDYLPEIKRLLRVRATLSPTEKYIGTGNAEFSGTVEYCVLYAGDDGGIYSAVQTEEYRFSVPVEADTDFEPGEGLVCLAKTAVDTATGRVVAPRRLSLKCRLRSRVRLLGTRLFGEGIGGADGEELQVLSGSASCARIFTGGGEIKDLGDEILFDAQESPLRVICAEGSVFVTDANAGSGCVHCHGEVVLKLLCVREGERALPYVMHRRLPFSGSVPADGVEINCECTAFGECGSIHVSVEEGRILCEVTVQLEVCAQRNETVHYAKDAYSVAAEGDAICEDVTLPLAQKCLHGNFSLNRTLSLEEVGLNAGQSIVDLSVTPLLTALENEGGRYVVTGRCRCNVILQGEEELNVQEFEIPFRYETEGCADPISEYDVTLTPVSAGARMDGERISVDAELAVSLWTRGTCAVRMLREASFASSVERERSGYTVCYPSREDTLWSVAKRYRRSVKEIMAMNPLSGAPAADAADSLAGVRCLLV